MKKILTMILSFVLLLSIGVTVSAKEIDDPSLQVREEKGSHVDALFENYYPEGLTVLNALRLEHDAFHASREALRAEVVAGNIAEREALKAAVETGELTRVEALEILLESTKEREALRTSIESITADKKVEVDSINESRKIVREAIQTELSNEVIDEAQIASLLQQSLDLLDAHIQVDYKYANMIDALLE